MPSHDDLNSVIVADDSGQCRNTLRTALMECGFLVLLVWDGLEALETASSTSVRLVLLDVRMPHMDGLQACARIRDLPGYGCVPIVMLSGYASAAMRAAAEQAGANLFLVKPISNLALKQAILPLLGATSVQPAVSFEWKRQPEPSPAYGEAKELAQGRRVLEIYRRANVSTKPSRGPDWFRRGKPT
ncbi:MAG TPA: response regulator [Acetobacteraceae bacterium]|nr:response regulator [Acetobacteraceae bacterium]